RKAALTVMAQERPLADLVTAGGRRGLESLPGIGSHLAYTIEGLIQTGEFRTLRPEGSQVEPRRQLTAGAGGGPHLAPRRRGRLGVATRQDLRRAADKGRLTESGLTGRRLHALMTALRRTAGPEAEALPPEDEPALVDLLAMDAEYRSENPDGAE